MKTITLGAICGGVLAVGLWTLSGCNHSETYSAAGANSDRKSAILLHKNITPDQWEKVKAVLTQNSQADVVPREQLYTIRKYDGQGGYTSLGGTLPDAYLLDNAMDYEYDHFTGHAIQIGIGVKKDFEAITDGGTTATRAAKPLASPGPNTMHAHYQNQISESQDMVEQIDKILNP